MLKKMSCIYKITNPVGKVYIGQTVNFTKRINAYKNKRCKKQTIIYRSLIKYGFEAHNVEVLESCDVLLLNERERFYQEKFNAVGKNGMNCRYVQTKDKSGSLSDETKRKLSIAKTGIKLSKEHRLKIGLSGIGKMHSNETKIKMRENNIGSKNAMYGIKHSKATKEIMSATRSGVNNAMYGRKHSLVTIEKLKISAKNRTAEWNNKISESKRKKVLLVDENIVFNSIIEASKHTGVSQSGISMVCGGKYKKMNGMVFRYMD